MTTASSVTSCRWTGVAIVVVRALCSGVLRCRRRIVLLPGSARGCERLEVDAAAFALPVTVARGLGTLGTPDLNGLLRWRCSPVSHGGCQGSWGCGAWGRFGR